MVVDDSCITASAWLRRSEAISASRSSSILRRVDSLMSFSLFSPSPGARKEED